MEDDNKIKKVTLDTFGGPVTVEYNPANAFANAALLKVFASAEEKRQWIENSDECSGCDGTGHSPHDCDCKFCALGDEECQECYGQGRVEKTIIY